MDVIVIGLGSMGRRRVRLLKQMNRSFIIGGVDNKEDRRIKAEEELLINTYANLEEAFDNMNPQCAIICTSPLSHADIIEACLLKNCHVFTELNLVNDKYHSNIQLAKEKNKVLFLSSTQLYRDGTRYIKEKVNNSKSMINYIYHVGQYLPDWHPWESINEYFVSDKRTNGCREILAIELPWIIRVFGDIDSYEVIAGKSTDLPIQYNDNYLLLIKHQNGNRGVLGVDVISRFPVCNLEIYGGNLYITWDGTPMGLKEYDIDKKELKNIDLYERVDKLKDYAGFVIENDYMNELDAFFGMIDGKNGAEYTFEDDYKVLELIDQIELGDTV